MAHREEASPKASTTMGPAISAKESHSQHIDDADVVKTAHLDGTVDLVDRRAMGGALEEMPKGYFLSIHFIGTVIACCLGSICAYLGWVLPANTLLLINEAIGPSPNINWVATAWTLGSGVGFLLFGRLSDIFGRKWLTLGTNILSLIGCIVGATASSVEALIGANVCNGIAAAGQLSFSIILGELVPNKYRGPAVTLVFLSSLPFAVFGPAIARLFILNTAAGWRWSYYLGIIFAGITVILFMFLYHPPKYTQLHVHGKSQWQQFRELDFGGLFLFLAGIVLFLIGLSWGGQAYPWSDAKVISTIVVGAVTLIAFGFYEQYVVKGKGIMPPRIFKNIGFIALVFCAVIGSMVYYSMTILWPTILGTVFTTDIMKIGWQSSVVGGGVLLGQTMGGLGISYLPKVKWQTIIASVCSCAFVASLASIHASGHAQIIVLGVLATTSIGYVENITFPGVTLLFEAQDIGLAVGVLGSIRAMGGAVAQALYVSILTTRVSENLPAYVGPAAIDAGLPESSLPALFAALAVGDFSTVAGITPEIIAVAAGEMRRAYIDSFKIVFYATIPFGVLLIVFAFFVPNMDNFLHKKVARKLQHLNQDDHVVANEKSVGEHAV